MKRSNLSVRLGRGLKALLLAAMLAVSQSASGVTNIYWQGDMSNYWDDFNGAPGPNFGNTNWTTNPAANVLSVEAGSDKILNFSANVAGNFNTQAGTVTQVYGINVNSGQPYISIGLTNFLRIGPGGINKYGDQYFDFTGGYVTSSTTALTVNQDHPGGITRFFSAINNDGGNVIGLTKTGAGEVQLLNNNQYTGLTNVVQGTLTLFDPVNNNSTIKGNINVASGATLKTINHELIADTSDITINGTWNMSGSGSPKQETFRSLSGSGTVDSGGIVLKPNGGTATFSGTLSNLYFNIGDNSVGTQILTGNSSYLVSADFNAGTLQIGDGGSTGSFAGFIRVRSGASLIFNRDGTLTHANQIDGAGTVTKTGPGTVILGAINTYTGGTTVNSGTLQLNTTGAATSSGIIRGALTINSGATVVASNDSGGWGLGYGNGPSVNAITINGGTLAFTGPNDGGTTATVINMNGGTISGSRFDWYNGITNTPTLNTAASNSTATVSSAVYLRLGSAANALTLNVDDGSAATDLLVSSGFKSGSFGGDGAITKTGAGKMVLDGTSTYTGTTTISNGTLQIGNGGTTGSLSTSSTITNNANLTFNRSNTVTQGTDFSGNPITGTGSVTKLLAGTLVLTADNTYTGTTTISGGTLQIGNGGTTGAITGDIVNNSALVLNRANSTTYNGVISGSGSLTNLGTGTFTVAGNNTYTGTTTISAGSLQIGDGGTTGTISGNIVNNANLIFNRGDTITQGTDFSSLAITGTGSLVKSGAGTLVLTANNTYSGTTTISEGTLQIGNGGTTGSLSISSSIVNNGNLTFNRSNDVRQGTSFSGNPITGTGSLVKSGAGTLVLTANNTYTGGTTISEGTLQIDTGGTAGAITGGIINDSALVVNQGNSATYSGVISGSGSLTKLGTGTFTVTGNNTYTGTTTISAGTLQIGNSGTTGAITGNIVNNSALVLNRADSIAYDGMLSGSGSLTKLGTGTFILTGDNTFTGTTTISAGKLQAGHAGALGTSGDIRFAGGVLQHSAVNQVDYSARIVNSSGAIAIDTNEQDVTYATALPSSNLGGLNKLGAGTLTVTGNNTYAGTTTISAGTLQIGDGGTSGAIPGNIVNNSALAVNRVDSNTYSGVISGSGSLTKLGAGTFTVTGDNTYSGGTTISDGTLQIGNGGTTGTISGTGNIVNDSVLQISRAGTANFSFGVSGAGSIVNDGTGAVTLSGTLSNTGGVTHQGSGTFTLSGSISNAGTITNSGSGSFTLAGVYSGPGSLEQQGTGTVIVTANNTYTGTTTVSAGTLQIGDGGGAGSVPGNITNNGNVTFNRSDALTYAGVISGSGSLTKSGSGNLTLTGANTYTGGTILAGGTLVVGNATTLPATGNLTFTGGAISAPFGTVLNYPIRNSTSPVRFVGGTVIVNNVIDSSNVAGLSVEAGTLILNAHNTYTGNTVVEGDGRIFPRYADSVGAGLIDLRYYQHASGTLIYSALQIDATNASIDWSTKILQGPAQSINPDIAPGVTTSFNSPITAARMHVTGGTLANPATLNLTNSVNITSVFFSVETCNTVITGNAFLGFTAGKIIVGNGGTTGTFSGNAGYGKVIFNRSDDSSSDMITDAQLEPDVGHPVSELAIEKLGAGTLSLTALQFSPTYDPEGSGQNRRANITINQGAVQFGNGGVVGGFNDVINNNSALKYNHSNNLSTSPFINGTGSLTKLGTGTLTLVRFNDPFSGVSTPNTFTGPTTIAGGVLELSAIANGGVASEIGASSSAASNLVLGGGTLRYTGATASTDRGFTVSGTGGGIDVSAVGTSLTFTGAAVGSGSLTKTGAGTLALAGSSSYSGSTTVNNGTLHITGPYQPTSVTNAYLSVTGPGLADIDGASAIYAGVNASNLTIRNGATVTVATSDADDVGPGIRGAPSAVATVTNLNLDGTSKLDLKNNGLIIPATGNLNGSSITVDTLRAAIVAGRGGVGTGAATWSGPGIGTSTFAFDETFDSIGYCWTGDPNLLVAPIDINGAAYTSGDYVVKYCAGADADLNGLVDDTDVAVIGLTYDAGATTGHHWYEGDFNYDGLINDDDVAIIGLAYNPSATPLSPAFYAALSAEYGASFASAFAAGSSGTVVPEPTSLGLLAIGAMGLVRRHRR